MDGALLTKKEHIVDITTRGNSSSPDEQQITYEGVPNQWRDIFSFIIIAEFVVTLIQIVAAIVVLILTKDEQQMYFRLIISYTCGCLVALPPICFRFFHYHTNCISSRRIHEGIDKLTKMVALYFVGWVVVVIWHLINIFSSLNPPPTQQFWLCMAFLAISCILYVIPNLQCAVLCFLCPLFLRLSQSLDFFDDITDKIDTLNLEIAGCFVVLFLYYLHPQNLLKIMIKEKWIP